MMAIDLDYGDKVHLHLHTLLYIITNVLFYLFILTSLYSN